MRLLVSLSIVGTVAVNCVTPHVDLTALGFRFRFSSSTAGPEVNEIDILRVDMPIIRVVRGPVVDALVVDGRPLLFPIVV